MTIMTARVALIVAFLVLQPRISVATSDNNPPIFRGETGQFILLEPIKAAPIFPFFDGRANKTLDLTNFRGKVLLLNFWATWCAPCVREMPSLDRLQSEMGGEHFEVVALSIDRAGIEVVKRFYETLGLRHLGIYLDKNGISYQEFRAYGLPTSYVIDRGGRAMGYLPGAADWGSQEAKALLQYYTARRSE
jgi:thiol-disulfide isomerase/thioredoxin